MKIKLFGALSQAAKQTEIEIQTDAPVSVLQLRSEITRMYPAFADYTYSVAVNRRITNNESQVLLTDEVAFLPPFAGG